MTTETNGHNGFAEEDEFEEIKIPVPWGHISGKWWGSQMKQPIIAIHGWQDNAGTFDTLAPILKSAGFSILCIDLPGHGLSSHYPEGQFYYVFWDGIHFLRRIVQFFKWKNVTILGHSLGGAIAFLYASAYPDDVAKYISIDIASPSVRDTNVLAASMGDAVDKFLSYETITPDKTPCYNYDEMIDIVHEAHGGSITKESAIIMCRRGMRPSLTKPDLYVFNRDPRLKVSGLAFFSVDQVMVLASRITCEVLNIRASPGLKFVVYDEVLDKIAETAKKMERHKVEGTHHLHLNTPDRISNIIIDFLNS